MTLTLLILLVQGAKEFFTTLTTSLGITTKTDYRNGLSSLLNPHSFLSRFHPLSSLQCLHCIPTYTFFCPLYIQYCILYSVLYTVHYSAVNGRMGKLSPFSLFTYVVTASLDSRRSYYIFFILEQLITAKGHFCLS